MHAMVCVCALVVYQGMQQLKEMGCFFAKKLVMCLSHSSASLPPSPLHALLTAPCQCSLPSYLSLCQEELRDQAAAVWRFIMDRQLEAPDEFAALQV